MAYRPAPIDVSPLTPFDFSPLTLAQRWASGRRGMEELRIAPKQPD